MDNKVIAMILVIICQLLLAFEAIGEKTNWTITGVIALLAVINHLI